MHATVTALAKADRRSVSMYLVLALERLAREAEAGRNPLTEAPAVTP
jgi:hypothetical protein